MYTHEHTQGIWHYVMSYVHQHWKRLLNSVLPFVVLIKWDEIEATNDWLSDWHYHLIKFSLLEITVWQHGFSENILFSILLVTQTRDYKCRNNVCTELDNLLHYYWQCSISNVTALLTANATQTRTQNILHDQSHSSIYWKYLS